MRLPALLYILYDRYRYIKVQYNVTKDDLLSVFLSLLIIVTYMKRPGHTRIYYNFVLSTWVICRQSIKILVGLETFLFTELNTIKCVLLIFKDSSLLLNQSNKKNELLIHNSFQLVKMFAIDKNSCIICK